MGVASRAHGPTHPTVNALMQVLLRVPMTDLYQLQAAGREAGSTYRYYAMNRSMRGIPTARHLVPDGGAVHVLAQELEKRKERGVAQLARECQVCH